MRGEAPQEGAGMPNTRAAASCICPYFVRERPRAVACQGAAAGSQIEQKFETPGQKEKHMRRCCCGYHYAQRCAVAYVLEKIETKKAKKIDGGQKL